MRVVVGDLVIEIELADQPREVFIGADEQQAGDFIQQPPEGVGRKQGGPLVESRGGEPGFVHVSEDGRTLYLPDRPGNNRLDTIRNLLSGPGRIGLMFMIPGFDDVLRVNGRASATADPDLLAKFVEFGKTPRLVLMIAVEEAFLHCPKAIMRARLWEADAQVERSVLPSGAEMIFEQLEMGKVPVPNEQIIASYKEQL